MTALEAFADSKGKDPSLLGNDEIGALIEKAQQYIAWANDLKEHALSALLAGEAVPGWKAVEGRSIRKFDNTDATFADLIEAGVKKDMLYERKPITLTAVEKLLGKAKFGELAGAHVIKPPGKPALAKETDKREAITNKTTAQEAFSKAS